MTWDHNAAYLAIKARDTRFDGRLFVGVTSTGIYCRPVCRVRTPLQKNCRFFDTHAQAEAAAFRPCMKCRPEIAPGFSQMDSSRSLADSAARLIEQAVHSGQPVAIAQLAARLGVTDRHLRRIFTATHGVAPQNYITTQRLLLAKHLLTDTQEPVTQVALASGFESLRRFNAAFAQRYRFNPTQLRRERSENSDARGLRLAYRPPYDVPAVLAYYRLRLVRGVEELHGLQLRRTVQCLHRGLAIKGWLAVQFEPQRNEVQVQTSTNLAPVLGALMQRVRQALDLDADPSRIDTALAVLPLPLRPGTRLTGVLHGDGFEGAVRVILGQQVTVKAACTLAQRLVHALGEPVQTPWPTLTHLFPTAQAVATASAETIGKLGIVRQRVGALQALARAVASGDITLHASAPLEATLQALRDLPGVGEWTAQVIAMRCLGWPDAWPNTDVALMNALGSRNPKTLEALAEPWRPWRAYAVMRLWHSIENPHEESAA
jgi:AraC family transcriptional regulator, regulatory protein of adaptative response / DNA-3-methyladenine glycosylase II